MKNSLKTFNEVLEDERREARKAGWWMIAMFILWIIASSIEANF